MPLIEQKTQVRMIAQTLKADFLFYQKCRTSIYQFIRETVN